MTPIFSYLLIYGRPGDIHLRLGAPEPLRYHWKGYWSRRINKEHRFVYKAKKDELLIAQCRYHY